MKKCLFSLLLLSTSFGAAAQVEPAEVTANFFADPAIEMNVPAFAKTEGFTTYAEMTAMLEGICAAAPGKFSMESVGRTQKGRDIPMVTISDKNRGGKDKLRVFYFARIHGNEPSGTEAMLYFIERMAAGSELTALLDRIDFFILPMINADGAETNSRTTVDKTDLNRDQSKLDTPEAQALHAAFNKVQPHVSVDFHEFQPYKSSYSILSADKLGIPWNVMFLFSSNPNVPKVLRDAVDAPFLSEAAAAMDSHGYTHHTYYTPGNETDRVVLTVGGASPRSSSTSIALKNCIALLMETRGIGLGRTSLKQRTYISYLLAKSFATTAYNNEQLVRRAIEEAVGDRSDVCVTFSARNEKGTMPFVNATKNAMEDYPVELKLWRDPEVKLTRSKPAYYCLLPTETKAIEVLKKAGIEFSVLEKAKTLEAGYYVVESTKEGSTAVGGVYPLAVTTKVGSEKVTLPAGSFVIDTRQRYSPFISALMEPESVNGLVNNKTISAAKGERLAIYRLGALE